MGRSVRQRPIGNRKIVIARRNEEAIFQLRVYSRIKIASSAEKAFL